MKYDRIFVFLNPQKGAYLVCVWLVLIALTLVASGNYLDVAVRDLAMGDRCFFAGKNICWYKIGRLALQEADFIVSTVVQNL